MTASLLRSAKCTSPSTGESFDEVVLPHLDAAYRLACWLLRNVHDAEDALQEALLRALRYFHTYTGGNGRAWLLRIVRNTCFSRRRQGSRAASDPFDEEKHSEARPVRDPEALALQAEDIRLIEQAMRSLPVRSRELLVLRDLEGLSYRELAASLDIPMGTVMSSLSRARRAFRGALESQYKDRAGQQLTAPRFTGSTTTSSSSTRARSRPAARSGPRRGW
jgi:RNA polymerase sigma-70 factor (ECF subfamily)